MAGQIKVDSINADSNLALKIANTAVAFIDSSGLRPTSGNVNLDATATSKFYLPSANTVAIQTAGVTAVTVDSSQNTTLAGTASATKLIPTGSSVTGNGMYLPAANALGLSTNGTNAVYIDSSQNVGIGTSSPKMKLNAEGTYGDPVTSGATPTGIARFSQTTNNVTLDFGVTTGNKVWMQGADKADLSFTYDIAMQPNGGNLLVGVTADPSGSGNNGASFFKATNNYELHSRSGVNTISYVGIFYNGNGTVGSISTNGSATSYTTSSDYRLKENIAPMTGALTTVSQLKPVTYTWKSDGSDGQGFIAHELQAIVPDCVSGAKDAVDAEGKPVHQGVDTSFLVATLTAAIQELKAIVDAQAVRIAALES